MIKKTMFPKIYVYLEIYCFQEHQIMEAWFILAQKLILKKALMYLNLPLYGGKWTPDSNRVDLKM